MLGTRVYFDVLSESFAFLCNLLWNKSSMPLSDWQLHYCVNRDYWMRKFCLGVLSLFLFKTFGRSRRDLGICNYILLSSVSIIFKCCSNYCDIFWQMLKGYIQRNCLFAWHNTALPLLQFFEKSHTSTTRKNPNTNQKMCFKDGHHLFCLLELKFLSSNIYIVAAFCVCVLLLVHPRLFCESNLVERHLIEISVGRKRLHDVLSFPKCLTVFS